MGRKNRPRCAPLQSRTSGMSCVSILSSGSAAKASISACCAGVSRSELPFFIGSPFVRSRFAGTDDATSLLPSFRVEFWPCMHHEHDHLPNQANGLPSFFAGVWIAPTDCQGIVEYQLCGLEAQPVIPFVGSVLCIVPCPTQVIPPCSYGNVVTFPPSCQECGHTMPELKDFGTAKKRQHIKCNIPRFRATARAWLSWSLLRHACPACATWESSRRVRSSEASRLVPAGTGDTRISVAPRANSPVRASATRASSPPRATASIIASLQVPCVTSSKPAGRAGCRQGWWASGGPVRRGRAYISYTRTHRRIYGSRPATQR